MIHHVVFYELNPGSEAAVLEELVRSSRSLLLKIPEVLTVRSGRNVDPESKWGFFCAIEVESRDKLRITLDDPFYLKFVQKHIAPHTCGEFAMDFELDPSRALKYS